VGDVAEGGGAQQAQGFGGFGHRAC
jgi:hypothetical protein